jgi:MFS family permease
VKEHQSLLRGTVAASLVVGLVAGASSAFAQPSFDEANWLAVARRMDLGRRLFSDLIDNKSPLVYWTVRVLDHAPGSFSVARGVLFGVLLASLTGVTAVLAKRLGLAASASVPLGVLVGTLVAFLSVLVLNTETPVVLLVLIGLLLATAEHPLLGAVVAAAATLVDIRAVAFLPGIVLFIAERSGRRKAVRSALAGLIVACAWLAPVLASSRLRYALIELNGASRGTLSSWRPGPVIAIAAISLVPLAAAAFTGGRGPRTLMDAIRTSPTRFYLFGVGLLLAFASAYPFFKYWILVVPVVPLLAAATERHEERPPQGTSALIRIALVAFAMVALAGHTLAATVAERTVVSRYERASQQLRRALKLGDRFVAFDPQPFLTTFAPEHSTLPWAVLDFLGVHTSHREKDLQTVARAIDSASAIEDDGALFAEEDQIASRYRVVWKLYRRRLDQFPCVRTIAGITLRLRLDRCAPAG